MSGPAQTARLRRVANGFPIAPHPLTRQELDRYHAGDKATCLLCGRRMKLVGGRHLSKIHNTMPDDYREMYGIPWLFGLMSHDYKTSQSEKAKELVDAGVVRPRGGDHRVGHGQRPVCQLVRQEMAQRVRERFRDPVLRAKRIAAVRATNAARARKNHNPANSPA